MLDVAKNPEIVFGKEGEEYIFNIENMVYINEKPNYVISFVPRPDIEEILSRENLSGCKQFGFYANGIQYERRRAKGCFSYLYKETCKNESGYASRRIYWITLKETTNGISITVGQMLLLR